MAQRLLAALRRTSEIDPGRLAVIADACHLSYCELCARSDQLGRRLARMGVGPEVVVGTFLERSVGSIVAFVGILKAGGAFLPLDPDDPPERVASILERGRAGATLTTEALKGRLNPGIKALVLEDVLSDPGVPELVTRESAPADSLAYILPTSASVGPPKSVMITRAALDAFLENGSHALEIHDRDVCLLAAPLSFVAGVRQSLMPLYRGARVVVADRPTVRDPLQLWRLIRQQGVTFLDFVPSYWSVFIDALVVASDGGGELDSHLERVAAVGELLPWSVPEGWKTRLGQRSRFFNLYGQTETTGLASIYEVTQPPSKTSKSVPVGRAIPHTNLLVLDEDRREVAIGEPGELYVRSPSLMLGYHDRADLTRQHLVSDRFLAQGDTKLCRTGDRARWLPSGDLEILGRLDRQIKIGGRRLELEEVESTLQSHPAVRSAAVVSHSDQPGPRGLTAYVVPRFRNSPVVEGHRRHTLPNGAAVAIQNPSGNGLEAEALFEEIFDRTVYLKHGIGLPDQGTVLDIGSNIGLFALFVGLHYPHINLFCFEPIPPIFDVLRLNVELFDLNAKTFNMGLSSSEREADFTYYPEYSVMSGVSEYADPAYEPEVLKLVLANEAAAGTLASEELLERADELLEDRFRHVTHTCQLRTLSSVMSEGGIESIDLLKIDTQRAELDVLAGVEPPDWAKIKQVVMELHDRAGTETEGRSGEIRDFLTDFGFEVQVEQDRLFRGTDRYNLYARKPGEPIPEPTRLPDPSPNLAEAAILQPEALRADLLKELAQWAIPQRFVVVDKLPETLSGKIDHGALAARGSEDARGTGSPAPRTRVEATVAGIWEDVLGIKGVGLDDNFFELGGDSLSLMRVENRLRGAFRQVPSLGAFFELPTVSEIAKILEESVSTRSGWP